MRIQSSLASRIAAFLAVGMIRLIFLTVRVDLRRFAVDFDAQNPNLDDRFLYSVWHDGLLMPLFVGRPHHMAALVSQHQDGSVLANAMRYLHVIPVRGSSRRGGAVAMRRMMSIASDKHITFTPDGPRGPRRKMKAGIVYLASQSGRRIVPMAFAASRCWRIEGRWTDMVLPKPFSTVFCISGNSVSVPAHLNREELARYVELIQNEMDRIQQLIDQAADGQDEIPVVDQRAAA